MSHFVLHVLGLPHTATSNKFCGCAYTSKVRKFCAMMSARGHVVYHYGAESSDPVCREHVSIITNAQQEEFFGPHDLKKVYDVNWDINSRHWQIFNENATLAIKERSKPGDFLCCITGSQKPVADALPELYAVEHGIGYRGTFRQFSPCTLPLRRCFESFAHLHVVRSSESNDPDVSPYDVVVPNYFDTAEFPFQPVKKDYFLFVGRLIRRKGIQIAVETARAIGAKLVIAGQGAQSWRPGELITKDETYRGDHLEFVGHIDPEQRAKLMGEARALFVPTQYCGPFEGVNVEAQLCGTPVITTDFGAFAETVEDGKTGFRCRTMKQFIKAAQSVHTLDPVYIRERAVRLYSLESVGKQFEEFFESIAA